jgi:hypothetical protein
MTGIIRTWRCLNSRCGVSFDAWEPNPSCPTCKCVRVAWQPAGGNVGAAAKGADAELRALADIFRMDNMNSAERGRAAKQVNLPPATASDGKVHTFNGGFSAAIDPTRGAQCVPTANKFDVKVKATPGNALAPNAAYPHIRSNTAIEGVHKS